VSTPQENPPKPRQPRRKPGSANAVRGDRSTTRIYDLIHEAEALYQSGHYREAIATCRRLAKLDPTNVMPEQMIEGCRREILKRRGMLLVLLVALAAAGLGVAFAYAFLVRISIRPAPGTLRLRELQSQSFAISSPIGRHRGLEYRWTLEDADGQPAPAHEQGTLSQHDSVPWDCWYTPPHSLVPGSNGGKPVVRRLVMSASDASHREVVHAEWVIQVFDTPQPPRVLAHSPRSDERLSVVAGGGERTFRVTAADGDGGAELTYEWLVGGTLVHTGPEPSWTYRPAADALPAGRTGRETPGDPPLGLTCRVTNRHGDPTPVSITWRLRLVRSNAPPQLIAFEPELAGLVLIKEGEERKVTARAYDPDEGESLSYAWDLDGAPRSRGPTCTLSFPHDVTDKERRFTLRLTVTDSCGASVERTWQIAVLDAPKPELPSGY